MAEAKTKAQAETSAPQTVRLEDYRPPDYLVEEVELRFGLEPAATEVRARLMMRRNPAAGEGARPLVLDGQELELLALALDGESLGSNRFQVDDDHLIVHDVPAAFTLETAVRIHPDANTALEGLYVSNGVFCTQCEPEGFRKITYFPDRPDVMARYRVRIEADQAAYPVLLANGNLIESGEVGGGRHFALWEDPFPKPAYLFALVAGRLARIEDTFTTRSGRVVTLEIYTEPREIDKCAHAMASLKKAMKWDEDRFGLEYDLDRFMIVAVSDFNFGAMENKGLNIFNTKFVLAKPETATDADYLGVESVIAHEYFHNWTGNRVTCRDWFQLSLKEGLTVFRDQEFTADLHSRPVKRISDVRRLRATQFLEDAGPLAHPVRPDSYLEINNFYTTTVYEKGAEVIRMLHTLIGEAAFQRGMRVYFERHDGEAVTCEDFVAAMEAASGRDLRQFRRWYAQAGTPRLTVRGEHDPRARTFTLTVAQSTPPTPGQPDKEPLHIPLALGLLDPAGEPLALRLEGEGGQAGTTRVAELSDSEHRFTFADVPERPVPSLLRGFSAPVILESDADDADRRFLMAHDPDPFVRWESGQSYALKLMLGLIAEHRAGRALTLDDGLADAFARTLADPALDHAFVAQALMLPSETYVAEQMAEIDVDGIHAVREFLRAALGERLAGSWSETCRRLHNSEPYRFEAAQVGRRTLKNLALAYLLAGGGEEGRSLCLAQFGGADNMTDTIAALGLLAESDLPERADALADFYARWRDDALVIDKWFALQATAQRPDAFDVVSALLRHEAFTLGNPNRVRSLIGAFAQANPTGFHRADGAGYAFVADHVLVLDKRNPQVASRLAQAFGRWRRYDAQRRDHMRAQLERILATEGLSRDVYEIASKSLK
ncbi:MAG TPA: aminopeptidase N [Geminicoccaceae bacterium]